MRSRFIHLFGWYGALAALLGYTLISFGALSAQGMIYQVLIVTASIGLTVVSLSKKVYQTALLNAVAMVVGLVAIGRILFGS